MEHDTTYLENADHYLVSDLHQHNIHGKRCVVCKKNTPTTATFCCGHACHAACLYTRNPSAENYFEHHTSVNTIYNKIFYCPTCLTAIDYTHFPVPFFDEIKSYYEEELNYAGTLLFCNKQKIYSKASFEKIPKIVALNIKSRIDRDYKAYQEGLFVITNDFLSEDYSQKAPKSRTCSIS